MNMRDADHLTLEWLVHLGGWQTAEAMAVPMEQPERFVSRALLRLFWRGVLEIGPTRGPHTTWRLRPELNTEER